MKILIAGDIHGSAYYCEKLIELEKRLAPDKIVLTGDILYHGPRNDLPKDYAPKRVIEMLCPLSEKILCVRGNCEAEVDQMVLDFPCLAEYMLLCDGGKTYFITHGHIYNKERIPKGVKDSVLVNGHTHVPAFEKCDGFIYINPGSVSIPKENSENSCVLLENGKATFYTVNGQPYRQEIID